MSVLVAVRCPACGDDIDVPAEAVFTGPTGYSYECSACQSPIARIEDDPVILELLRAVGAQEVDDV